ncbi:MAG: IclR family transcriptional regulator [Acidobacteria bacterium]|nr:IclR family transcriptional regulator [Acidobacteriota bacterium]
MTTKRKAKTAANINDSPYQVQVLDRALGILDSLSNEGPELGPAELSERLELHKSTVHRLLMVLERHRLIEKKPQNGKYRLGMKLFELGNQAVTQLDLRERAQPYLERLVLETGETAHICVLNGDRMLSIANVESSCTLRTPSTVGRRTLLHCTSVGKAMLAFLPEDEADELIEKCELTRYTGRTLTTLARLKAELRLIRQRGYAIDNEEFEEGLRCVGAPVRDYSGKIVAALGIAGPAFRLTEGRTPKVSQAVLGAAKHLSEELGYRALPTKNEGAKITAPIRAAG